MAIIFAMDESLKARLIGAAVLVALAVILIPELLTGRGPAHASAPAPAGDRGTRTIVIDVGGNGATPSAGPAASVDREPGLLAPAAQAQVQESVPEPAATLADTNPAPVAAGAAATASPAPAATPAATPAPAAAPPAQAPRAVSPAPAEARGAWAVQVGAFGSTGAADKVINELRSAGFRAYVSPVQRGGKTLYRVRVGPEPERARADALAATLKGRGLQATVVAND
jgi:DedD protein